MNNEDVARGIDVHVLRQLLGVVAAITPFDFPAMIPLWFLPYAVASGNCFVLKPSKRVQMTSQKLFELLDEAGLPPGVVGLVNGDKEAVDALLEHPQGRAVSFVGSTPVAKYVYATATANGKRAQCQSGAKNPAIVLPDADMEMSTRILGDCAFGCAGQRCLATSVVITVGQARKELTERIGDAATSRIVGCGLDESVQMGLVMSRASKERVVGLIERGTAEGARLLVDGRGPCGARALLAKLNACHSTSICERCRGQPVVLQRGAWTSGPQWTDARGAVPSAHGRHSGAGLRPSPGATQRNAKLGSPPKQPSRTVGYIGPTADCARRMNALCGGCSAFFRHTASTMTFRASELRAQRATSNVDLTADSGSCGSTKQPNVSCGCGIIRRDDLRRALVRWQPRESE